MRSTSLASRILSVVVALVLVGLLRSLVPAYLPSESLRFPDSQGRTAIEDVEITLDSMHVTKRLVPVGDRPDITTDHVFVVVRFTVRAVVDGPPLTVRIDSGDKQFMSLTSDLGQMYSSSTVLAGTTRTMTAAVEMPEEDVAGSTLIFSNPMLGRVEPMRAVAVYDVTDLGDVEESHVVEPDVQVLN